MATLAHSLVERLRYASRPFTDRVREVADRFFDHTISIPAGSGYSAYSDLVAKGSIVRNAWTITIQDPEAVGQDKYASRTIDTLRNRERGKTHTTNEMLKVMGRRMLFITDKTDGIKAARKLEKFKRNNASLLMKHISGFMP